MTSPLRASVLIESIDGLRIKSRAHVLSMSARVISIRCSDPYLTMTREDYASAVWKLALSFPSGERMTVEGTPDSRHYTTGAILVDVRILQPHLKDYQTALALSLLSTNRVTSIKALARLGLPRIDIDSVVEYRSVTNRAEVDAVFEMRTKAYRRAHKYNSDGPMFDEFDQRAIVIAAFIGARPVASMRLMAHGPGQEWEHDRFVDWPTFFPPKAECVEVTRMCVDPDFQRVAETLFAGMLKRAALVVRGVGRRYVLGCATDVLLPIYSRVGCKITPVRFTHADLGTKPHTLILADVNNKAHGIGIDFRAWAFIWRDTAVWMRHHGWLRSENQVQSFRYRLNLFAASLIPAPVRPSNHRKL